jgi:hypothetical protein
MTRAEEFLHHLDAKDEPYLRAAFADYAQAVDEISRGWTRGREAVQAYITDNLPRLSEIHSTVEQSEVRRWDDVEVETFVLHQHYVYDDIVVRIEAPTTLIWRREDDVWRIALFHSIPLPPAS